ncbi:MAG: dihydropteroate synthase [Gemmatimonadota bacterium]|nr:dihydropteroate synthase [Gemmatimonadota bacterium]MDH3477868.1 dihydropteroate synthase [Gemmatimonadota bacterium]MDH3568662.1 dihydropteroate synthase [Gemmatimonadota bacterium]MDH5549086.1 dihydropteroate synthase [Gemmatimonadota bacterium]
MTVLPLQSLSPAAVEDALIRRGVDQGHAAASARGMRSVTVVIDDLSTEQRDLVLAEARRHGVECLTGERWALLTGGAAALAGLVHPDRTRMPLALAERLAALVAATFDPPEAWVMGRGRISLDRPVIAGILNVTPDSFSDGGRFLDPDAALRHAESLIAMGADLLDVGAESTRPGSVGPVPVEEEWHRLAPVLRALEARFPEVPLSVDTVKAETARRALDSGAWAINDVSGLRLDPTVADVCAAHDAGLVLMHSRGAFDEMASYAHASYGHVVAEVVRELTGGAAVAEAAGLDRSRIVLDPGLGFAKTPEQNFEVLRDLPSVAGLGYPVMVGPSRKRFLGTIMGRETLDRDLATAAACVTAYLGGARLFRVHAVAPTLESLAVAYAVRSA